MNLQSPAQLRSEAARTIVISVLGVIFALGLAVLVAPWVKTTTVVGELGVEARQQVEFALDALLGEVPETAAEVAALREDLSLRPPQLADTSLRDARMIWKEDGQVVVALEFFELDPISQRSALLSYFGRKI